jgi:hypothetical protein
MRYEFVKLGGYDCITDAFVVYDDNNRSIVTFDLDDLSREEAERYAALFVAAPDLVYYATHTVLCGVVHESGKCTCGLSEVLAKLRK